ncbi:MAG: exosome complex protein Rrp42 [Candidatus Aenigmatarchaeota archaeon]|nr:exosome complex protein Rrp42 [Nanoarchaeota archaeon]
MGLQERYVLKLIEDDKRIDGRKMDEYRKIEVIKTPTEKPEGSARVKMGNTDVIVGVKMDVGEPFSDRPDEGILMVNSEFSPLASPGFELGPPKEDSIELARVVDRGIRESGTVDVKKLCIKEGEKVWMVFVDINILNHDGNLIDASGLAAITALSIAKLPEYADEKVDYEKKTNKSVPLKYKPIPVTVCKLVDSRKVGKLIIDPSLEEEAAVTSRLTVTTRDDGQVCSLQKGGDTMTIEEVQKAIELSLKKGEELRKLV